MVELFEQNIRTKDRQSSKGNQLKWENNGIWYKADYTGYEGLAEYVISHLLKKSTLDASEFVCYDLETIKYGTVIYNGAGLLADTTMDYPLSGDVYTLMDKVQSKTICGEFEEQLDISEALYKMNLKFRFTKKDVTELLADAEIYSEEIRNRVEMIIFAQMRKYPYLFSNM